MCIRDRCWTASQEILLISRVVTFTFNIEGFSWVWSFLVSPALGVECIIGADFICKSGLVIDIKEHQSYFKFNRGVVIPFLGYQAVSYTHLDVYKRQIIMSDNVGNNYLNESCLLMMRSSAYR